jgi:hypothetical protein
MMVAAIIAIGMCAAVGDDLRSNFAQAVTPAERIESGLTLLDDLLTRQWSENLTVELAMIGLPDAARDETARALIDEALVVTDAVDAAIRQAASGGIRVTADAARWRRARGLACAAAAVLGDEPQDRSVEAMTHLQNAAAGWGDASGRLRRMLAQVHLSRGEGEAATQRASEVASGDAVTPLQRTLAEAVLVRGANTTDPQDVLNRVEAAWQAVLIGEAILRASPDTTTALGWIGPIRSALGRCGIERQAHGRLAAAMAARLTPPEGLSPVTLAGLDPAAIVGVVRGDIMPSTAANWMTTLAERAPTGPDELLIFESLAHCLNRSGNTVGSMRAWQRAAGVGGAESARCWDEAAHAAVVLLGGDDFRDEARDVLETATARGVMRAAWMRSLAAADSANGHVDSALDRLGQVPPTGPDHVQALSQIGQLLGDRRRRLGRWSDGDRNRLEAARLSAVAAASQQTDLGRSAMARPIAGVLAAMLIEQHLDKADVDAARAALREDEAIEWLPTSERAYLEVRIATLRGRCDAVASMLPKGSEAVMTRLVLWAGGPSVEDAERPDHPAALACLLDAVAVPTPAGTAGEMVQMAEALRRGSRCDAAVVWYEAALAEDANLLPAVLGRCECLRSQDDRAVLTDIAGGYRRIAAMPREDDPARWRLANMRLLDILRRTGTNPARIEARLARLRALDPLVH